MLVSRSFWQTYKEVPADAEIPSHQLMVRAGLIHKAGSGLYNYLPMGLRSIQKFESIIRQELNKIGSQEIVMSVVTPGELWQETGRWDKMGGLMIRFKDKKEADLCLSPTNEEAVTDIFRKSVKSYKQLPVSLYQINTKFRDEIRPRFGLMRGREFTMKDAYSFHATKECMDEVYSDFKKAYTAIFTRAGLEFIPVEADGGAMADSGSQTHEFQVVADAGEDLIIYSAEAPYAANIEKAQTKRAPLTFAEKGLLKEIETPTQRSIEEVAIFLSKPKHHLLKTLLYIDPTTKNQDVYAVVLLGDDELNEIKLMALLKRSLLVMASDADLERLGLIKGFVGPKNLPKNVAIVVDAEVSKAHSYVVGANKRGLHLEGFNLERDLVDHPSITGDLRMAQTGDLTLDGKHVVTQKRGIEVGHIFQLGDKYTKEMKVTVLDQQGKQLTPLMGCYGIGVTRVIAAAIEQCHDADGIIWPKALAPYQVYLASIVKSSEMEEACQVLYKKMLEAGIEVLFDDRNQGPGVKFKDADLLGLPLRVVFGERDVKEKGEIQIVERKTKKIHLVPIDQVVSKVQELWNAI